MYNVFGLELRKQRLAKKLTLEQLAHDSEVGLTFLKELEAGSKQPSLTTLFKLSFALDVMPEDLLSPAWQHWRKEKMRASAQ